MKSQKFSESPPKPLLPTRPATWSVSEPLTKSEIDSLRQGKKHISDCVQKALGPRLKASLANDNRQPNQATRPNFDPAI